MRGRVGRTTGQRDGERCRGGVRQGGRPGARGRGTRGEGQTPRAPAGRRRAPHGEKQEEKGERKTSRGEKGKRMWEKEWKKPSRAEGGCTERRRERSVGGREEEGGGKGQTGRGAYRRNREEDADTQEEMDVRMAAPASLAGPDAAGRNIPLGWPVAAGGQGGGSAAVAAPGWGRQPSPEGYKSEAGAGRAPAGTAPPCRWQAGGSLSAAPA